MNLPKGFHKEVIEARESNTHLKNEVSYSPISKDGANFETHVLYPSKNGVIKFKPTIWLGLFALFMFASFCVILGFGINGYLKEMDAFFFMENIIETFVGIVFFVASIYIIHKFIEPIVFDKHQELYYRGFKKTPSINVGNCENYQIL